MAVPAGDSVGGVHLLALAQEGRGGPSLVRIAHMEPAHAGAGLLAPAQSAPRALKPSLACNKKQAYLLAMLLMLTLNVQFLHSSVTAHIVDEQGLWRLSRRCAAATGLRPEQGRRPLALTPRAAAAPSPYGAPAARRARWHMSPGQGPRCPGRPAA